MIKSVVNRHRAERARREVAAFIPQTEEHARLRLLLITMLDFMVLVLSQPKWEKDFERAWECVEDFRAQMEAPSEAGDTAEPQPRWERRRLAGSEKRANARANQ